MKGKVFLTGGAGRIGKRVLTRLLESGYEVRALVHRHSPDVQHEKLELFQGDILQQEGMKEAVKGCRFICHLAAAWDMFPPAVYEKENNQLFESIIRGTYNLLEASYPLNDLKLFLYASTDAVYATGLRKFAGPITEDTELFPSRFYALAKIVCESMCTSYGKLYSLPWLIVRICWSLDVDELLRIYSYEFWEGGMSQEDRERLRPRLANGKGVFAPLQENGDSGIDQIAAPEDIAEGILLGIERHESVKNDIYNLAGPAPFRYLDVIDRLAEGLGVPWGCARIKGIEPYELRNDRARKKLGYDPGFSMEMMIERAVQHMRSCTR
jgi:nucleoside-diphosphate-sugar epimerase